MIEVKNLKISFGKLNVLKDVSIKIEKGESNLKLDALFPLIRELKIDPNTIFYPENEQDDPAIEQLRQTIKDCTAEEAACLIPVINSVLSAIRAKDRSKL